MVNDTKQHKKMLTDKWLLAIGIKLIFASWTLIEPKLHIYIQYSSRKF